MVSAATLSDWLKRLGYADEPAVLHARGQTLREAHPYALEIETLLRPDGAIRARVVFDIEGVPTVVFLGEDDGHFLSTETLDAIRQRIWNQNLATVVVEVCGDNARILPARKLSNSVHELRLADALPDGPFSALDVASANLSRRIPAWFDIDARVDRKLLNNLSNAVDALCMSGFKGATNEHTARRRAELLMGQVLFISYLEHRQIVAATYRERRKVSQFHSLISSENRDGVSHLIDCLRQDFNGDFLGNDRHDPWAVLNNSGFHVLDQFLRRTDMETGQGDFWNYDFSFIPVELLSGLYESFVSAEQQAKEGAFYTPRHLAMMAVDQAFAESADPLAETIFDGACGSGILLTTAYRRLISLMEARRGSQLSFKDRRDLLVRQIYGADINFMACRVTAFSLYLSLLEGLNPADILEAQERDNAKLPSLDGENLHHGNSADFFTNKHAFAGRRFSLLISNPPWAEPLGEEVTTADLWSLRANAPFVRRQIAGAYAIRALDFLAEKGRLCLILPIPQFLAPTSAPFVAYYFGVVRPKRLINFGDLQNLLFPTAESTCHLFLGERRASGQERTIPFGETFDYCIPKADLSLAYGRLTMQSADRHTLQTRSIVQDPQLLVTMMWGDANDLALWTRLVSLGRFSDFWRGPREARRWVCRKGVHFEDASRSPVSADRLRRKAFVPIAALRVGSPILHPSLLTKWPTQRTTVASLGEDLIEVFDGPRVLFPDGFSRKELSIRAVYFDGWASFNHSIGVIAGPTGDSALLQFAAVYLRSSLARYFLMMRGWKMLCERNGVHLIDVEGFPFYGPDSAPNPKVAHEALKQISRRMREIAPLEEFEQVRRYDELKDSLDDDVFNYFGLSSSECTLVRETVDLLMPSIRPRSFKSLDTPAQKPARAADFKRYSKALADSLTGWRKTTGGEGQFHVTVVTNEPQRAGPLGVVRIEYADAPTAPATSATQIDNQTVHSILSELRKLGLSVVFSGEALQLVPDAHIWTKGTLYLVRPLTRRSWTIRQALRDAEQIVRRVQRKNETFSQSEVA
jgi:hypothetical protein